MGDGADSIRSQKPIVPNGTPKVKGQKPQKATPKPTVPVGQKSQEKKQQANNNEAWDNMVAAFKAEPNWYKKAKIYLKFCVQSHETNTDTQAVYAYNTRGI